jgi:hypothetical protein
MPHPQASAIQTPKHHALAGHTTGCRVISVGCTRHGLVEVPTDTGSALKMFKSTR